MRGCDVNTCDVNTCQYQDEACSNCLAIHRDVPDDPEIYLRGWQEAANLPEQSRAFFEVAAPDAAPRGCEANYHARTCRTWNCRQPPAIQPSPRSSGQKKRNEEWCKAVRDRSTIQAAIPLNGAALVIHNLDNLLDLLQS